MKMQTKKNSQPKPKERNKNKKIAFSNRKLYDFIRLPNRFHGSSTYTSLLLYTIFMFHVCTLQNNFIALHAEITWQSFTMWNFHQQFLSTVTVARFSLECIFSGLLSKPTIFVEIKISWSGNIYWERKNFVTGYFLENDNISDDKIPMKRNGREKKITSNYNRTP